MFSDSIFEMKTVQAIPIKTLLEALKEILVDCNFQITNEGLKIVALDEAKQVLVHLRLFADRFEFFHCEEPTIIGVNLINLHKIIKSLGNNDMITFFARRSDPDHFGIIIENSDRNRRTTLKLNILDLEHNDLSISEANYESMTTLPSSEFLATCSSMNILSNVIEIRSTTNSLLFSGTNEFVSTTTEYGLGDHANMDGLSFQKNPSPTQIVQGRFELKKLMSFTKCTKLCNLVELYLANNQPLVMLYKVASLGEIKLCLSPKAPEDN